MNLERERELFEKWYSKAYMNKDIGYLMHNGQYSSRRKQHSWDAWIASVSRDGYKLVPVDFLKRCDDHLYTAQCYEGNSNENLNQIIDDSIALKAMIGAVE